jgi:acetolactate synthase small subunit
MTTEIRLRTFIMHVEDLPGVLNRVTSLFRRRTTTSSRLPSDAPKCPACRG